MPDASSFRAAPLGSALSSTLSLVAEAVIVTDEQSKVTLVNPAAEKLTKRSQAEAGGLLFADACPLIRSENREAVDVHVAAAESPMVSCTLLAKDGREIPVEVHCSPIYDSQGGYGHVIVIREPAGASAESKRSRQELELFARGAAHDLESPLKAVLQLTQLLELKYGEQLGDDARQYMAFIAGSVNQMDALVKSIVSYFEVLAAEIKSVEPVALDAIVASSILNLKARIDETGATVTRDALPAIRINAILLSRLFQNLLHNSLHYHGEQPPRIHCSAVQQDQAWLLSVADNSVGISPEYQERIFEPFKRLHGPDWPGSGLGLAICKKIVERIGGRIWVESDAGKGATFYFTIPLALDPLPR